MNLFNNKFASASTHQFAMVPKADIPRSTFLRQHNYKTTFDENYLIPIFCDEVLPGDTFGLSLTAFCRMTTPLFPIMDNLFLDTFFFFVPNRLVWTNWVKFMGEQTNPADSISYTIPQCGPGAGYAVGSLHDYIGLPTTPQMNVAFSHSNLPLRAYNLIWNQWFRDENLQNSVTVDTGDGPDSNANYVLLKRGKRHDYFTSALPWTQKGGVAISIPLGTSAPIKTSAADQVTGAQNTMLWRTTAAGAAPAVAGALSIDAGRAIGTSALAAGVTANIYPSNLYADLSTATAATINQLRQSFQIQRFLERDARSGTRYTELIRAHFGVISPDARLQRPEYLGGGNTPINIAPIPQTTQSGLTGGTTPLGTLGAHAAALMQNNGFTQSFTEHGYIIGLANVRADLTYQQGIRRHWKRSTRYDFYHPVFAALGEQSVYNYEIYMDGSGNDALTFGYQERWAEYRYLPSMISGNFKSTFATPLDAWHLAEKFTTLPTLGATFIQQNTPISRVAAVNTANTHFLLDAFFNIKTTRAMPLYSVPGMIDHF